MYQRHLAASVLRQEAIKHSSHKTKTLDRCSDPEFFCVAIIQAEVWAREIMPS